MSVEPVTPQEIKKRLRYIPDIVIRVFNEAISNNYRDGNATVYQRDIIEELTNYGLNKDDVYKNGWLNVENHYRQAGWVVEYNRPGYNEFYEPRFKFSHT